MRHASMAPAPAGEDAPGGAVGTSHGAASGLSRLQMPQVVPVLTRPPIPSPSEGSGSASTSFDDAGACVESGDDGNVVMAPARRTPPTSPSTTRKDGSVQVAVRVRPLLPKEILSRVGTCVKSEGNKVHIPSNDKTFTYDHVFPVEASQKDLYNQVVEPLMDPFLQGYNVTILAYGQTGAGKTYTMGNDSSTLVLTTGSQDCAVNDSMQDHVGVIPRFIDEMFAKLDRDKDRSNDEVTVSFLEIYGEEIRDLLDQNRGLSRDGLQIRESSGSVWVQGLTEVKVANSIEASEQMRRGCFRRITGSTGMNERSSRSHAIYTVKLVRKAKKCQTTSSDAVARGIVPPNKRRGSKKYVPFPSSQNPVDDAETESTVISKLTFVDLAGSERLKKTQAEGDRMKEGIQINVGLLALGNVITALGDERRRSNPRQHVAYRDSKLTRLLQDALGGNSRTLFIACISPAESSLSETINTLQYASRAKNIQNKAVKNIDPRSAELARLKVLNDVLRSALTKACALVTGDFDYRHTELNAHSIDVVVLDYLRKLEQIAWSVASGALSSSDATLEVSKAMSTIIARRGSLPACDFFPGYSSSKLVDAKSGSSASSLAEMTYSDTGSSVHFSGMDDIYQPTNLAGVARVLQVIGLTLEIQELRGKLSSLQAEFNASMSHLDARLSQKNALVFANEAALEKMKCWETEAIPSTSVSKRMESFTHLSGRLDLLKIEVRAITEEKETRVSEFDKASRAIQSEIQERQLAIEKARLASDNSAIAERRSSIDLIVQVAELKNRFGLAELCDVAWALQDDEKEVCEFLDDEPEALAFEPRLFSGEVGGDARSAYNQIQNAIESAIVEEDLHTSQCKKLRERTAILQRIVGGWTQDSYSKSEEEFLAANEEQLRSCEESIREISQALRHRRHQNSSIGYLIDGMDSLDLAKGVIRSLVDALYGHKRIAMTRLHVNNLSAQKSEQLPDNGRTIRNDDSHEEKLRALEQKFCEDLAAAYESVRPFSIDSLSLESEAFLAQRQDDAIRIRELEERNRLDTAEITKMQREIENLTKSVDSMKEQFQQLKELAVIREECEQLAKELGLQTKDFSGIAALINPLAMAEAREICENLRAQKASKMEQIDLAWSRVKRLEMILEADDTFDLTHLGNRHESLLDDQLFAIRMHQKKLADELSRRLDSHLRVLDSIYELVTEVEIARVEDLLYAKHLLCQEDLDRVLKLMPGRSACRQLQIIPDLETAIAEVLPKDEVLNEILSVKIHDRNSQILKALLLEKTTRHAEIEKIADEIRSLVELMALTQAEVQTTLHLIEPQSSEKQHTWAGFADEMSGILGIGFQIDTSVQMMKRLITVRDGFVRIRDCRSKALSFLTSKLDEAEKIAHEEYTSSGIAVSLAAPSSCSSNQMDAKEWSCSRDSLQLCLGKFQHLFESLSQEIRPSLLKMNSILVNDYGIDNSLQRLSFFLGSDDTVNNPNRKVLEKYLFVGEEKVVEDEPANPYSGSLLSELDPAYEDYARFYSPSFTSTRLSELRNGANEVRIIKEIVQSANTRLESLRKISGGLSALEALKKEIKDFAQNAQSRNRLFGNSSVLLQEDKMRKRFAREYASKIAYLREEATRWAVNERGEFDLGILGEGLKKVVTDQLNEDTHLMHLDVGVLDPSRPSARRASKTAAGMAVPTLPVTPGASPNQSIHPNQESSTAVPRTRPGSALARDGSGKKR